MDADDIDDEGGEDGDFAAKLSNKMRTETINVELPKNPWKNTETTAIIDRVDTSSVNGVIQ